MSIDWIRFTPQSAAIGGVLIGLAAAVLLLFNGRIAGVSGIVGGLAGANARDRAWRVAFVLGLLAAPGLYQVLFGLPESRIEAGWAALLSAGFLVGLGTRYASGCTSGHGVCGLSRGSPRSIAATLTFMLAGFATVFVSRHLFGS
jgi:uncharacterized membrane protein YedE/YeeE